MKKLLLLGLGLISLAVTAQTMPDIEVTIMKPVANANLEAGTTFDYEIQIKNTGTTAITTTDSIINLPLWNGSTIGSGPSTVVWLELVSIAPGASVTITHPLNLTGGTTGQMSFCGYAFLFEEESDTTNNMSCNTTNWDARISVGEFELLKIEDNSFYNAGAYNVKLENATAYDNASLVVFNISGQEILVQELEMNNGKIDQRVELGNIPSGIYLMNIKSSAGMISTQKVMVR